MEREEEGRGGVYIGREVEVEEDEMDYVIEKGVVGGFRDEEVEREVGGVGEEEELWEE